MRLMNGVIVAGPVKPKLIFEQGSYSAWYVERSPVPIQIFDDSTGSTEYLGSCADIDDDRYPADFRWNVIRALAKVIRSQLETKVREALIEKA